MCITIREMRAIVGSIVIHQDANHARVCTAPVLPLQAKVLRDALGMDTLAKALGLYTLDPGSAPAADWLPQLGQLACLHLLVLAASARLQQLRASRAAAARRDRPEGRRVRAVLAGRTDDALLPLSTAAAGDAPEAPAVCGQGGSEGSDAALVRQPLLLGAGADSSLDPCGRAWREAPPGRRDGASRLPVLCSRALQWAGALGVLGVQIV
jgi:hypothetical protein